MNVDRTDVTVESLVPTHLQNVPIGAFIEQLETLDAEWQERLSAASKAGRRLIYLGRIEQGKLNVGVHSVDAHSPFARLSGTDNMIVFTTKRYAENPLVIQGPGAGREVTAAGILADLIKAAQIGG